MAEFVMFDWPNASPTSCMTCGATEGPIAYLRDIPAYGACWMCQPCIAQLARLIGCSDPGVAEALREAVDAKQKVIDELEDRVEIERRRQINVVALEDAVKMAGKAEEAIDGRKRRRIKVG